MHVAVHRALRWRRRTFMMRLRAVDIASHTLVGDQRADRMYLHAVAVPPTDKSATLGARVEHILVDNPGRVSEVIAGALGFPEV